MSNGNLNAALQRAIVRHVMGPTEWNLPFLIALTLGGNLLVAGLKPEWRGVAGWTGFVMLAGWVVVLVAMARRAGQQLDPVMVEATAMPNPKVLVLFLSPAPKPELLEQWNADANFRGGLLEDAVHKTMGMSSWRMPVTALRRHAGYLDQLVVIPSADAGTRKGTWQDLPAFRKLLDLLTEGRTAKPTVVELHELTGRWPRGVDFENADELKDAMRAIFTGLRKQRLRDADIIVDITGGSKVASVVGAIFALGKDQIFQYVSQHDYKVIPYNVTYVTEK